MTAMSLIVQPHAAFLLTDTAHYLADGTVKLFAPKVMELHFGSYSVSASPASAAFALTGIITAQHIETVLKALPIANMHDLLAALPEVVRGIAAAIPTMKRSPDVGADDTMLLALAMWDAQLCRPRGFLIGNESCQLVRDGLMLPSQLVPMREYVQRQASKDFAGVDFADPAAFNPRLDAGQLLDRQREDPFGDDRTQFTGVGGQGILTEISAAGIRYHLLRSWADRVGERIGSTPPLDAT